METKQLLIVWEDHPETLEFYAISLEDVAVCTLARKCNGYMLGLGYEDEESEPSDWILELGDILDKNYIPLDITDQFRELHIVEIVHTGAIL